MCHIINLSIVMSTSSTMNNTPNTNKCTTCKCDIINGTIRNNKYYCDKMQCFDFSAVFGSLNLSSAQSSPQPVPQFSRRPPPQVPVQVLPQIPELIPEQIPEHIPTVPTHGFKCTNCNNHFPHKTGLINDDCWFCDKQCFEYYKTKQRYLPKTSPINPLGFASNFVTVLPLRTGFKNGAFFMEF